MGQISKLNGYYNSSHTGLIMKTVGFNIKSGIGFGIISGIGFGDTYNPSIRYTWKSQTNQDGTRLLKDLTTPKHPAEVNSSLALEYNGVDEGCVVELEHTLGTNLETTLPENLETYNATIDDTGLITRTDEDGQAKLLTNDSTILNSDTVLFEITCSDITNGGDLPARFVFSGFSQSSIDIKVGENLVVLKATSDTNHIEVRTSTATDETVRIEDYSVKLVSQEELHLYRYNYDNNDYDYENITTPTPYYDLGKENGTGDYINRQSGLLYVSKRPFTPEQLTYLQNSPETFLYRDNGVLKSGILQ